MSTMEFRDQLEYWKKVKDTIHLFDRIIVQYVVQWSAILLGMIGASVLVFSTSHLTAGVISLAAILVAFPIAIKCYFYYELLEEALSVGIDIEKLIFKTEPERQRFGLTHRLCSISTRQYLGITFFGWTIFLPFAILGLLSLTLSVFYFDMITTMKDIVLFLFGVLGAMFLVVLFLGFVSGNTAKK